MNERGKVTLHLCKIHSEKSVDHSVISESEMMKALQLGLAFSTTGKSHEFGRTESGVFLGSSPDDCSTLAD